MSDRTLKPFPSFKTDEEAEHFVDTADLSEYDFSEFRPMRFEFVNKAVPEKKALKTNNDEREFSDGR